MISLHRKRKIFTAENVSGLIKGASKQYLTEMGGLSKVGTFSPELSPTLNSVTELSRHSTLTFVGFDGGATLAVELECGHDLLMQ